MKLVTVALLIVSLILLSSSSLSAADFSRTAPPPPPPSPPSFCDSKCGARCFNAGVMDRCLKYCGICCRRCKCVPSGTYGNKSQCPCYRDMKNSKGKSKCP